MRTPSRRALSAVSAVLLTAAWWWASVASASAAGPPQRARVQAASSQALPLSYWMVGSNGAVHGLGTARPLGSIINHRLSAPVVGINATLRGGGYWLVAGDGGVFSFGNAPYYGSTGGIRLHRPVVGMAATPDSHGYWLVASDGGVFSFGNARFHGSTGNIRLNRPVVGMAATPDGQGYWLVASDGGVFSFGNARFHGSTGNIRLNKPIVGMAATPDGQGYWLVASDGGVFSFGNARYYGSTGNIRLNKPIVGMTATATGAGYWLAASDGGVFTFGNALFRGSLSGSPLTAPIVGMTRTASVSTPIAVTCTNTPVDNTNLASAVALGELSGQSVIIGPGTCYLTQPLVLRSAVTISGGGPGITTLVEHARSNLFYVSGPNATVEEMSLDTCTYNATGPPANNEPDPDPAVLYSYASYTTVADVTGCAGNGYGILMVGPQPPRLPCYTDQTVGTVLSNVAMTNSGIGGYASVTLACQRNAFAQNLTIHGNHVGLYEDSATTLQQEHYTPGAYGGRCAPPWYITGPSSGVTVDSVVSFGGSGHIVGSTSNIRVTGQQVQGAGCS